MDNNSVYESGLQALAVGRCVGRKVKERLGKLNVNLSRLSEILLPKLNYENVNSVKTYVSSVSSGFGINYLQGSEKAQQRSRERLSRLLYQLEFNEDEDFIKNIKGLDPKFEYPPIK